MYTLFETLFLSNEMSHKYICVLFYSLNFLKPVHDQNVHLLPQYTPNNDVEREQVSECKASTFQLAKFDEHWIFRYKSHENIASRLLWGSWKNLHDCINTLVISGTSLSSAPTFQHILHRSIDFKLSRILIIVTLVGGGVVPNSTRQRRWIQKHSPLSYHFTITLQ